MDTDTLYRRLREHIDRGVAGFPATRSGVEIRILRRLFTPEEAEIALELSAIPEPLGTVHKRLRGRLTLDELRGALDRMAASGLIMRVDPGGTVLYAKLAFIVGIYERQLPRLTAELEADVREYTKEAFGAVFPRNKTTQMRTVPVNRSIAVERNVLSYDDLRSYVESHAGPFAKMKCICRHGMDLAGTPCKQTSLRESCLTVGVAATTMVEMGYARGVERQEMLELIDAADREGLVLQPENTKSPLFICCCCGCCCGVITAAKRFEVPAEHFNAGYYAEIDPDTCQDCGMCATRCQMDAITDGGKPRVDLSRCIGCGLCATTCPSGALGMRANQARRVPPDDTRALYLKLLRERYGPVGLAKISARRLLGMKF